MEQISGSPEWKEWQQHPQTKAFQRLLRLSVQEIQEDWCSRAFIADDQYKATMLNSAALGQVSALQDVINAIERIGEKQ